MKWSSAELWWIEKNSDLLENSNNSLERIYIQAKKYFLDSSSPLRIILALSVLRRDFSEFRLILSLRGRTRTGTLQYGWYISMAWGDIFLLSSDDFVVGERIEKNNLGVAKAEILKDIVNRNLPEVKELVIEMVKGISFKEVRLGV